MLKWLTVLLLATAALGCTPEPQVIDVQRPPTTKPSQSQIVGTWKMISMTEDDKLLPVTQPFFMRFYADGTAATWPTPVAPITRGKYKYEDGVLSLPGVDTSTPVQVRCTHEKLWYWSQDGECLCYRVEPDLEPGKMP